MKKMLITGLLFFASNAFSADYTCKYDGSSRTELPYAGELTVTLADDQSITVKGNYTMLDSENSYAQQVNCQGHRSLPETRAGYFKKWASYYLKSNNGGVCKESSIRVSKDLNGIPDMRAVTLINYNGDTHDDSGYQSFFFSCNPK